jgi:phosphoribosylamine--glycine ligase
MEDIGILIVSYGSREVAMAEAFQKSNQYEVSLYIVDKQNNPFNSHIAKEYAIVPDLDIKKICDFAKKFEDKISFGIVGSEKPIIDGIRDLIEKRTKVKMICPTKECAIEGSKIAQRRLFQRIAPKVNPKFKIFDPKTFSNSNELMNDVKEWITELNGVENCVIKPDKPGFGKGVGVGGEHFYNFEQAYKHFLSIYGGESKESVIIEERIDGEESSYQGICDGKHLIHLPETRDYKRAFDNDKGPNTGGMGSYKSDGEILPFMSETDRQQELMLENEISVKLMKEKGDGLRGIPFYDAIMHTGKGQKILERNSRPGDPEIINLLPILKDDFVEICLKIIEGDLTNIYVDNKSTVVTYVVPVIYPNKDNKIRRVNLEDAYKLKDDYKDSIRIYPASMVLRDGETFALSSRTVSIVGIAESINSAREISLKGAQSVKGKELRFRTDIASEQHIAKSINNMKMLRNIN